MKSESRRSRYWASYYPAWFLSSSVRCKAEATAKSLRLEFQQRFNQKLFEKRLETYPQLYRVLGDLGTKLEDNKGLTNETMKNTLDVVSAWDRENSVLVSSDVISKILLLRNLLAVSSEKTQAKTLEMKDRLPLFRATLELQKALRVELGVYIDSSFREAITDAGESVRWKNLQDQESKIKVTPK